MCCLHKNFYKKATWIENREGKRYAGKKLTERILRYNIKIDFKVKKPLNLRMRKTINY